MQESTPVRYTLVAPVSAVKLREHLGSSMKTPTETLVNIPAGATVEVHGTAAASGLVNVRWNNEFFSVFYDDLAIGRD
ncbi:MAG TPA: hypothetical protein VME17_24405 [Bryobacteraceae bacterium]|nr:hypothetical protein [Bryobacteraceae bacterium]